MSSSRTKRRVRISYHNGQASFNEGQRMSVDARLFIDGMQYKIRRDCDTCMNLEVYVGVYEGFTSMSRIHSETKISQ